MLAGEGTSRSRDQSAPYGLPISLWDAGWRTRRRRGTRTNAGSLHPLHRRRKKSECPRGEDRRRRYRCGPEGSEGQAGSEWGVSRAIEPVPDPHTAEYKALLAGIELARQNGINALAVFSDSRILVNQVNKLWKRRRHLKKLCLEAQEALKPFKAFQVSWIHREWNKRAHELASEALASS